MRVVEEANPWPLGLGRLVHRSRRLVKDQKDAKQSWRLGLVGRLVHHSRRLAKNPKILVEANPDGGFGRLVHRSRRLGNGPRDARRRSQS
ncbi:unnamed protein product [Sphagnum tenellum]